MISNTFVFLYGLYHWSEVASCRNKLKNAETRSSTSLNTITKFYATHNIDRERSEKYCFVCDLRVLRYLHTRFISRPQRPRHHIRKWFQVWEFERSVEFATRNCRIAMVYLFGRTIFAFTLFPFFLSTCADSRAKHNPMRDARVWLWESICQRIFPFGYVRIKGRRAYPFLTYSPTHGTFYCIYIDSIFTRKFFQQRYYDMNKRRGFYHPRPSFSPSYDES